MLKAVFIIIILLHNIILNLLPDNQIIGYWDEVVFILLVSWFFVNYLKKINKNTLIIILLMAGLLFIGLTGNAVYEYQTSYDAIIRDIVLVLKFPLTLVALSYLNMTKRLALCFYKMIPVFRAILFIIFVFGILSIFFDIGLSQQEYRGGIHPYQFMFTHPTYAATFISILLLAMNAAGRCSLFDDIMALSILILGMRTKALVFVALYIFIKYSMKWMKKIKIIFWGVAILLIIATSYDKLVLYASYSSSPRETIYLGSIILMQMCFPIGSGFASFASHLSAKMDSGVYNIIPIAGFYADDGSISPDIGDAGYPYYLAQFGVLGTIVLFILIKKLINLTKKGIYKKNVFPINMMWIMIAVTLTSETLLVNNGVEVAIMLAIVCKLCKLKQEVKMNKIGEIQL